MFTLSLICIIFSSRPPPRLLLVKYDEIPPWNQSVSLLPFSLVDEDKLDKYTSPSSPPSPSFPFSPQPQRIQSAYAIFSISSLRHTHPIVPPPRHTSIREAVLPLPTPSPSSLFIPVSVFLNIMLPLHGAWGIRNIRISRLVWMHDIFIIIIPRVSEGRCRAGLWMRKR